MDVETMEQWKTQGFTVWDRLPHKIIQEARDKADFSITSGADSGGFGSQGGVYQFPSGIWELDNIPLYLLPMARQLLGTTRLILSQADCWIKHSKPNTTQGNSDQRMHCDWGNNQLIPSEWDQPSAVSAIVYLDGPEECTGGGTAVVPNRGSSDFPYQLTSLNIQPGYGSRPFMNNREDAEAWFSNHHPADYRLRQSLYKRELVVEPRVGRVLWYRLDTWHRGLPIMQGSRRVYSLIFQRSDELGFGGQWNTGFWRTAYWWRGGSHNIYGAPEKTFVKMTPDQRTVLGLPPAGHVWWTRDRLYRIKLRLPDFVMEPYLQTKAKL